MGPQGAVVGAFVGAVLGDSIEQRSEATLASRHRVLLDAIEERKGADPFTRGELVTLLERKATRAGSERTSVSRSTLDRLTALGCLERLQTGHRSLLVVDLGREEARSTSIEVARADSNSKLQELISKVLEREGVDGDRFEHVDHDDVETTIEAVNGAVGDSMLAVVREPCKYRLTDKGRRTVEFGW